MKRILIVANRDLGTSGVPAVIMSIIRGLRDKYVFDVVVFEQTEGLFSKELVSYGGNVIYFNIKKPKSLFGKIWFYLFGYRSQILKQCKAKIDIDKYFAIHSFKDIYSFPFFEFAKKHHLDKRILHINGVFQDNARYYARYLNRFHRYSSIKYATINLAVSKLAGDSFFGKNSYTCIYNPIDDQLYRKLPPYEGELSLTQIGTFSDRKNQLFSIEVFKKVKEKYNNARINFLGYEVEEGYLDKLKRKIKDYHLEDSVFFYDQSYNQIELLKKTSICLFPSKSEAFGLVAVENQACNRPVLCSKSIIKDVNCGGALFLEFDPQVWLKKIELIYTKKTSFDMDISKFNPKSYCLRISDIYSSKL